jgi:hypothetical protein
MLGHGAGINYIGEATLADAILDRLLHGAHRPALFRSDK